MALLSDNTKKTVKLIIRSRRSFDNDFIMYVANLSKYEAFTKVDFTVTEVIPDPGYKAQFEVLYTFGDLIIGINLLTVKIVGEDLIKRISTYTVVREYPHDNSIIDTSVNEFPIGPYNPQPADEALNIDRNLQLIWEASDIEDDTLTYDVYFGKSENPTLVAENLLGQTGGEYPTSNMKLDAGAIYAWKVVIKEEHGISEGPIWTFRIANAPDVPNGPVPIDKAIEIKSNIVLKWISSSLDGNPLTYDVYFGPSYTPPQVVTAISNNYYTIPYSLASNMVYYWKVVVKDNKGNVVLSPKWKFKTG